MYKDNDCRMGCPPLPCRHTSRELSSCQGRTGTRRGLSPFPTRGLWAPFRHSFRAEVVWERRNQRGDTLILTWDLPGQVGRVLVVFSTAWRWCSRARASSKLRASKVRPGYFSVHYFCSLSQSSTGAWLLLFWALDLGDGRGACPAVSGLWDCWL